MNELSCPDEARDVDEDRLSRSATEFNASATHSSSSILLQVPQFLQQMHVESSTGRRRGTSARRGQSEVTKCGVGGEGKTRHGDKQQRIGGSNM